MIGHHHQSHPMNSEMEHNYEVGNAKNIQDKVSCFLSVYLVLHLTLYMQQVGVLSTLCNLHLDLIIVLLTLYKSYIYVMIQHRLERLRELGLNCRTTYLYSFFWSYHTSYKKEVKCSVQDHKTEDDSNYAWYIWHVPIIETRQSYPYCCFPLLKKQPRCKLYGPLNHPVRPKTVQANRKDTPGMIRC